MVAIVFCTATVLTSDVGYEVKAINQTRLVPNSWNVS